MWVEMAGLGPQQAKSSGLQLVPGTRRHALQFESRVVERLKMRLTSFKTSILAILLH